MRADFIAADLQASWDSSLLLGRVAAILAAQVPGDGRIDACHPALCNVKLAKLSIPLGELLATSQPDARALLCPNLMLL